VPIPGIAFSMRRLHNTRRSDWWFIIALVPIIEAIDFLIFIAQEIQSGANQYGSNPKEVTT
jgi:uncharacterized membrane protein YhaH (DUF805 family)